MPQDVGARWTDGRSIGMRRGHSARTCGRHAPRSPSACPARLCLQVLRRNVWPVRIPRGSGEEKRREKIIGQIRCSCCEPHTCSLMSPLAASELPSARRDAAIFSNTYENDNPTTKLKNEVEISIIHPAVARVGSDGSLVFRVV